MSYSSRVWIFVFSLLLAYSAVYGDETIHVVKQGDTIYSLSQKYHVPAESIAAANGIKDPSKVRVGQEIRIPDVYIVGKGDTLYGIARDHGISFQSLITANGLDKNAMIKAGQSLFIPSDSAKVSSTAGTLPVTEKSGSVTSVHEPGSGILPERPLQDPRAFETKKIDSSIIWPVSPKQVAYLSGKVYGVSITGAKGESVKAIASGTVVSTGPYRGFGKVVFIQTRSGYIYVYGGLDNEMPDQGETVNFGDSVGTLGADSLSGKPLLYFMVYNKDVPVDPAKAPRGY